MWTSLGTRHAILSPCPRTGNLRAPASTRQHIGDSVRLCRRYASSAAGNSSVPSASAASVIRLSNVSSTRPPSNPTNARWSAYDRAGQLGDGKIRHEKVATADERRFDLIAPAPWHIQLRQGTGIHVDRLDAICTLATHRLRQAAARESNAGAETPVAREWPRGLTLRGNEASHGPAPIGQHHFAALAHLFEQRRELLPRLTGCPPFSCRQCATNSISAAIDAWRHVLSLQSPPAPRQLHCPAPLFRRRGLRPNTDHARL